MAKNIVLDALIPREDFEIRDEDRGTTRNVATIGVRDLEYDSFFFSTLRKPDFQRETNEWDAERVIQLIESFVSGDLIPSVIFWRSLSSYTFVIDGAHRLSALAAWVNNDFGDGDISKSFYDGKIPEEQIDLAEELRKTIRRRVGLFSDYAIALKNPEKVDKLVAERAKSLGSLAIQVQWVDGDAKKAENSFFKINQQAAAIDKTELKLLQARRKPNGIAVRAILRSGKGHQYWSAYEQEIQEEIKSIACEINELLFEPVLKNPIKTLDLPMGGKNISTQGQMLILEVVNASNGSNEEKDKLKDDIDGKVTINFMKNSLKIIRRINSQHPSSLGLHPAVYFYSKEGRHKPVSFWAVVDLMMKLDRSSKFSWFVSVRKDFESFLIEYDYVIQQIVRRHRVGVVSYPYVSKLYWRVIEHLHEGCCVSDIPKLIKGVKDFSYITLDDDLKLEVQNQDFSREKKSEVFMREALSKACRCAICGGYLHANSITIDHIQRKQDGGLGAVQNGQLAHPYCNTTFKN